MRTALLAIAVLGTLGDAATAFDFEPVKPLDEKSVEPAMLADMYGTWEIRNKSGTKRCRIILGKEFTIGGYQVDKAPGCEKTFPVMDDISAWRLLEGWSIDLVDPIRRIKIRFETPDNRYVPFGDPQDIAGIDEIVKVQDKPDRKKK